MPEIFSPVSSRISRRSAASEVSPHLILPPGMPHLPRPFVRADHQHFARAVENQRADGRQRRFDILRGFDGLEVKIILQQHALQFAKMLDNQIRLGRAQLVQRVVAGQHGAGMDAAVLGRLDVVFHVADEQRFVRLEIVFGEDFVDFFALVPNIGVGLVEKGVETGDAALRLEIVARGRCSTETCGIFSRGRIPETRARAAVRRRNPAPA